MAHLQMFFDGSPIKNMVILQFATLNNQSVLDLVTRNRHFTIKHGYFASHWELGAFFFWSTSTPTVESEG